VISHSSPALQPLSQVLDRSSCPAMPMPAPIGQCSSSSMILRGSALLYSIANSLDDPASRRTSRTSQSNTNHATLDTWHTISKVHPQLLSTFSKTPAITARGASGNKQLGQEVDDGVRSVSSTFFSPALLPFHGIFLWPYACISVTSKCISSSHGKSNHVCAKELTWRRLEVTLPMLFRRLFYE
jgi:hypothetical protein